MSLPLNTSQLAYAQQIVSVGRARGASDRDIQTALTVALTESGMRNLANPNVPASLSIPNDGTGQDHASVGLFQQQVGIWGDAPSLMDPTRSANLFYDALDKISNRNGMSVPMAAQTVQRSEFSDGSNYAQNVQLAGDILAAEGGTPNATSPTSGGMFPWILDSRNWRRIGLFMLGAFLLYLALWKYLSATGTIDKAVKLVGKVI